MMLLQGAVEGDGFPDFTMPNVMKAFPQLKDRK